MPPRLPSPRPAAAAARPANPASKKKRRSGPRIRIGPPPARSSRLPRSAVAAPKAIAGFPNAGSGNNDSRNDASGSNVSGSNVSRSHALGNNASRKSASGSNTPGSNVRASGSNVRARLQPCRNQTQHTGASAPEGPFFPAPGARESTSSPGGHPAETPESPAPAPPPAALDRDREPTITVKEAAYRLGKSDDTIYKWLRTGRLRGWQPGGPTCHIQVSEESVSDALRQAIGDKTRNATRGA